LYHLALAIGTIETERGVEGIRRFLVVLEHEVSTHGVDRCGEPNAQSRACDVNFVDGLVADLTVTGVPNPMPVVVKPVLRKRLHRSRTCPQIIIHAGWNRFLGSVPN